MSDKRYVDAAFAAGATDYVTKPFEVSELKARLGLVEGLVQARQSRTKKIFATQAISASSHPNVPAEGLELYEPISIYDVDNVIEYMAMGNYVAQLSRSALDLQPLHSPSARLKNTINPCRRLSSSAWFRTWLK